MDPTVPPFPEPKQRPSAWWFAFGTALVISALVVGIVLFVRLLDGFVFVEAAVAADDQPHQVSLGTDGDRFLWVQEYDAADCSIRDVERAAAIDVRPVQGTYNRTSGNYSDGTWVADGVFDPGSGRLSVTCASTGGPAEIGPAWDVSAFVVSILVVILGPLALGGLGTVILIVTGILWAVRPKRD